MAVLIIQLSYFQDRTLLYAPIVPKQPRKSRKIFPEESSMQCGKWVFERSLELSLRDQCAHWSWQSPNNSGRFVRAFFRFSGFPEDPGDCHVASLLAMTAFIQPAKHQFVFLRGERSAVNGNPLSAAEGVSCRWAGRSGPGFPCLGGNFPRRGRPGTGGPSLPAAPRWSRRTGSSLFPGPG